MYNYVIIHGSFGSQYENWFGWLYNELTNKGSNVLVPQMPCGEDQNYINWCKVFNGYKHLFNENTTFVCHSLSPAFIVNYLIDNNLKANKLILVAPFYEKLGNKEFDEVNSTFLISKDFSKIQALVKEIVCFVSTNDPYVPNSASLHFANKLNAKVVKVSNAGHFNEDAGYLKFELLLNYL